jgi:hypothetical protein
MATTQSDTLRQPFKAPLLDMVVHGGESCARTFLTYQQEMLRFTASRLQSGAELGRTLMQTRDWFEAATAQQRWFAASLAEYAQEAQRLLRMSSELAIEHARQAEEGAHSAAHAAADAVRRTADQAPATMETGESAMRSAAEAVTAASEGAMEEAQATSERAARRYRRSSE